MAKAKNSIKYKKIETGGLNSNQWIWLILVFFCVVLAWIINANNVYDEDGKDLGVYGDKFGAVNALFSGLAFAGIIFTIILQRNELKLQREESRESRKEFTQQNFETTFFNLLKNQQHILSKISGTSNNINSHITDIKSVTATGANFFILGKRELRRIMSSFKHNSFEIYDYDYFSSLPPDLDQHPDEENRDYILAIHSYTNYYYGISKENWQKSKDYDVSSFCRLAYAVFFTKYHYIIGHYFRHLYHIFKFLNFSEESELKEVTNGKDEHIIRNKYRDYAQFVQAQMSAPELLLLYYNALAFDKMRILLIKYEILNNLTKQDLVEENNDVIIGIELKNRGDIFDF